MPYFEWNLRRSDVPLHREIKNSLLLPEFILNIAKNRGIDTYPAIMSFAFPQMFSLPSPFMLHHVDKSVSRIIEAINKKEKILIFGDKDADGVTSTAIIYRIISRFKGDISFRVPEGDQHYGISYEALDEAYQQEISLIITVDCGITAIKEAAYAKELGIDLIITDHHEPLEELPDAFALINPKLHDYPFPFLAGAGVAFKLAQALAEAFYISEYNQELVFFDIETTGLDPEHDEITEIAAIITKNGVEIDHFQCLVKTSQPLNSKIIEITGITNKMLESEGICIQEALQKFINFIGDRVLIGHNIIGFDMKFIQIQLKKYLNTSITNHPIDTLPLSRVMFKHLKSHALFVIGEFLGLFVDQTKLHRALNDVRLNAEIYRRMILTKSQPIKQILSELFPLAAIGTVADIMPLEDENRIIVKMGIDQKNVKLTTIGLITLLRRLGIMDTLDSKTIGWTLGPIINSPGRLGQAGLVVQLLISSNINQANVLVEELIKKDQERKDIITSLESEIISSTNHDEIKESKYVFIVSDNIARGLTGLIATKLSNQFHVPVIIIAKIENGTYSGSVRSTGDFNIVEFLHSYEHIFIRYGGHKSAGGFVIEEENISVFKEYLQKYMNNWTTETLKNPLDIDIELTDLSILTVKNINYMNHLFSPIGSKNQSPNFLVKNVALIEQKNIGKNKEHVFFKFRKGKKQFSAIAWGFASRWNELKDSAEFDVVGIPEINEWNDNAEVRFQIIDINGR
ncbi:MAG: single-stranded-DNA-specific exonuclease RecJ [Brevinema sp.]